MQRKRRVIGAIRQSSQLPLMMSRLLASRVSDSQVSGEALITNKKGDTSS